MGMFPWIMLPGRVALPIPLDLQPAGAPDLGDASTGHQSHRGVLVGGRLAQSAELEACPELAEGTVEVLTGELMARIVVVLATFPCGARGRLWGGQHDCLPLGERLGIRVVGRGRLVWDGEVQWSSAPASALPGLWRWPTTLSPTRDGHLGGFFLSLHPVV